MDRAALVVIDVQNDFVDPKGAAGRWGTDLGPCQACVPNIVDATHVFRSHGLPVIFVRSEYGPWTDSTVFRDRPPRPADPARPRAVLCAAGTWGSEFYGLRPEPSDRVVTKRRYSAFVGTDLEMTLHALGVTTVFFAGVTSDVCVDSTARDAFMRDFDAVILEDCCAAYDQVAHEHALRTFRKHFGRVMPVADVPLAIGADQSSEMTPRDLKSSVISSA